MSPRSFASLLLTTAVLAGGCETDPATGDDTASDTTVDVAPDADADVMIGDDGTPDGVEPDAVEDVEPEVEPCLVEPTIQSLETNYFATSCAFSSCHGSQKKGNLDLREGAARASLVDVAPKNIVAKANGKVRVLPGDPDASFIVQKVEGTMSLGEGELMPVNAKGPIDPECRIKALRDWIAAGAPE